MKSPEELRAAINDDTATLVEENNCLCSECQLAVATKAWLKGYLQALEHAMDWRNVRVHASDEIKVMNSIATKIQEEQNG